MIDADVVALSRIQFGLTASFYFLFVPLTIGLSVLLAIMESVYVMTGRRVWRQMTRFWGRLFGINFAMGMATGIALQFQFGTNWAYFSHAAGDVFGVPLAIGGLMALFLETSFVVLFLFGWTRLSKRHHLSVTWLVAIGANLSLLWLLVANGWMQNPVGAEFNTLTMRLELTSPWAVLFNPVAQAKFIHTVSASYLTGATFVLAISAWYLLRGRSTYFAQRSMVVAAGFGLASALSVAVLGGPSGYTTTDHQKMKLAAMAGMWESEKPPASFILIGWPDQEKMLTAGAVKIPYLLGIIATRSLNTPLPGIKEQIARAEKRIVQGIIALNALALLRIDGNDEAARNSFEDNKKYLGYGLLLRRYVADPGEATPVQIALAARDTVPTVLPLFWGFRIMVAIGLFLIVLFAWAFWETSKRRFGGKAFRRVALLSLPLPWIAGELGWFVAEHGRQPWTIEGLLPTYLSASDVPLGSVIVSLGALVLLYTLLAVATVYLMVKHVKRGPAGPGKKRPEAKTLPAPEPSSPGRAE